MSAPDGLSGHCYHHSPFTRRAKAFRYPLNMQQGGRHTRLEHFSIIILINLLVAIQTTLIYLDAFEICDEIRRLGKFV
jgi:hypothetical protein